jgi:AraC-like DNA-binding protein
LLNGTTFLNALRIPPLNEILDWRLDLQSVIGPEAEIIPQRLREAKDRTAQITILEDFLVSILRQRNIVPNQIDRAADMIIERKGMLSMDQLAATLCMSPRQLRRKFKEQVGIGPKAYARLKRFNYISHRLSGNPSLSWKEFIDYGGFYDQSHFIREFQDLSGDSPTAFVRRRQALREKLLA